MRCEKYPMNRVHNGLWEKCILSCVPASQYLYVIYFSLSLCVTIRYNSNLQLWLRLISRKLSILVEHEKKLKYKEKSMKYNGILL